MFRRAIWIAGLAGIFTIPSPCLSQTFTLSDTNTVLSIVADDPVGIDSWTLDGLNQLATNTYLWRVGDSGPADFLQNLPLTNAVQVNNQILTLTYTNADVGFAVDVFYTLVGGTVSHDLSEIVRVRNLGPETLDFSLFQYNDFNLRISPHNDVGKRVNSSIIDQGDGNVAIHTIVGGAVPEPTFSQLGNSFLGTLTTTVGYNLDTAAGSGIGQIATGDVAYAFQWDRTLEANNNFIVSTNKIATAPEPCSIAALGLGALAIFKRRRKVRLNL